MRMSHAALLLTFTLSALPALAGESSLRNEPAPPIDLPSLSGERFNLADHRGKIVVLHFGTGW